MVLTRAPSDFPYSAPALQAFAGACYCADIRKAGRVLARLYDEVLAPHRLTIGQFSILANVQRNEGQPLRVIADRMHMDQSALSRGLGPLERAGLIEARRGEADRRCRVLYSTELGRRRFDEAAASWLSAQERIEARLGAVALEDLRRELRRLIDLG